MKKAHLLALYRIFFAVLAVVAIGVQLAHSARQPTFNAVNFFSFFTIESNIFAAVIFLLAMVLGRRKRRATLDLARGAATLYMTITGLVYSLLLAGQDVQVPLVWVNATLHYIMPIVVLGDWLADRPRLRITFRTAAWWIIFPLLYVTYSLIRGPIANWYPYPFLDPVKHGYARVALTSAVLAIVIIGLVWLLAWVTRWRQNPSPTRRKAR